MKTFFLAGMAIGAIVSVSGCTTPAALSEACLASVAEGKAQRSECQTLAHQPPTAAAIGDQLLAMGEGVEFQTRDIAPGKSGEAAIAKLRQEGFFESVWDSKMTLTPPQGTQIMRRFRAEWGTMVCNMGAEVALGINPAGVVTMIKGDVFERGCL
jgi:hypothetical protein